MKLLVFLAGICIGVGSVIGLLVLEDYLEVREIRREIELLGYDPYEGVS